MVRIAGKNETWQAGGLFPYVIGRAPSGWRDHAIFELTAADIDEAHRRGAGVETGAAQGAGRRRRQAERDQVEDRRIDRKRAQDRRRARRPAGQRGGARHGESARHRFRRRQEGRRRQRQGSVTERDRQGPGAHAVGRRRKGRRALRGVERLPHGLHRQEVHASSTWRANPSITATRPSSRSRRRTSRRSTSPPATRRRP